MEPIEITVLPSRNVSCVLRLRDVWIFGNGFKNDYSVRVAKNVINKAYGEILHEKRVDVDENIGILNIFMNFTKLAILFYFVDSFKYLI